MSSLLNRGKVVKGLTLLGLIVLLYLGAVLAYGTATDWQPEGKLEIETAQVAGEPIIADSLLSFVIWNLGYGGLGEESDFFYDSGNMLFSGGQMVRAPREYVDKNNRGILEFVSYTRSDFFLFQEVDYRSRRSYYTNQFEAVAGLLPDYYAGFAPNYQVDFVPIPLLQPWKAYGATYSGLATYSRFQPAASERLQLPGAFSWPTRIFQLDRCLAVHRYPVANGRELVVINIHHSAYDADGSLKRRQMEFLREVCLTEYEGGNYVVVGGDWNQVPPYFQFDTFMPGRSGRYGQIAIDPAFLPPDWLWVYDPQVATNRKIDAPYEAGRNFVTLIDFYLVSPNVRVLTVKAVDLQFRYSDHQPVYLEIELD